MPRATVSAERVATVAGRSFATSEWAEALFPTKAELSEIGAAGDLVVEATPDRLDLLCDSGLGAALAGLVGPSRGAPPLRRGAPPRVGSIRVDPSVRPIRPEIAAVELDAPAGGALDAGLLAEAIRFQELLHATVGLDRRLVSFGLYAVERLQGPLEYRSVPAGSFRFIPLGERASMTGEAFYATHPMAARYGAYGATGGSVLVLRDSAGEILSLPPVLNAEGPGSVRPGDRRILLEATGTRAARIVDGLGLLMLPFVVAGWSVAPVPVEGGPDRPPSTLPIAPRPLALPKAVLDSVTGGSVPEAEVAEALARSRLDARSAPEGWVVDAPAWRPDLLQSVDLVEEVTVARGIRLEDGVLLPSATRGRRRAETRFREAVGELLLAAGFVPLHRPVLVASARQRRVGRPSALRLANPVSEELAVVRDRILPSLVGTLARNVRHAYPQRFSEVGPVVEPDPSAEPGGRTVERAGFVLAGDGLGFAEAAARVDAVLRGFGAKGVREPATLPGALDGRSAVLRVAGEAIAEVGELHPNVLEAERIPVPVAFGEIDLSALWPLVRLREAS